MKEICGLISFEYKKIFGKKVTWITLGIVLVIILFTGAVSLFTNIEAGGETVSSSYENAMEQKKEELSYSGEVIDEELLSEASESYRAASLAYTSNNYDTEDEWNQYRTFIRPYISLAGLVSQARQDINTVDGAKFYEARKNAMEAVYKEQELSEDEIAYHFTMDEKNQKPFVYHYTEAYERFFAMQYSNGVFVLFAVAICTASIFAGEYTSKVDALILSARFGKNKLIAAKLLAGFSFAVIVSLAYSLLFFLEMGLAYGFEGGGAPIQVQYLLLSYPVTMQQAVALLIFFGVLAACLIAGITMLCSAKMKSNFSVIILATAVIFVGLFLQVPYRYHFLHFLVSLLPRNMVTLGGVFSDSLLRIGNQYFCAYQYVPAVYAVLLTVLAWLAFRGFKRHQIC